MHRTIAASFAAACLLFATLPASSAPGDILKTYSLPNAQSGDRFGRSVTTFQNKIVASAITSDGGSVHSIDPATGNIARLPQPAGITYSNFGAKVLGKGTKLYVSDRGAEGTGIAGRGAVFVYDNLSDTTPLIISDPEAASTSGFAYAFDANSAGDLAISAFDNSTNIAGKVYVYAPASTTPVLTISPPEQYRNMGTNLAVSDAGQLAAQAMHVIFLPVIHIYNLETGAFSHTIQRPYSTLIGSFGSAMTFSPTHLYAADPLATDYDVSGTPNFGAIGKYDTFSQDLETSYSVKPPPANSYGSVLHNFDNMVIASGDSAGPPATTDILFLDSNLNFLAKSSHTDAAGFQFADLGPYLVAGARGINESRGAVYLMSTPQYEGNATLSDLTAPELTVQTDCKSKTSKKGTKTTCKLTGTITVSNQGFVESGKKKASITIFHSTDATLSPDDTRAGKAKISAVAPFGSAIATFKGKTKTATTGTYLIAVIDDKNQLPESSETNNQLIHGPMP